MRIPTKNLLSHHLALVLVAGNKINGSIKLVYATIYTVDFPGG